MNGYVGARRVGQLHAMAALLCVGSPVGACLPAVARADARLFVVGKGGDPEAAVPGEPSIVFGMRGETVALEIYLEIPEPGRRLSRYLVRMPCHQYFGATGSSLVAYLAHRKPPFIDSSSSRFVYSELPETGAVWNGDCLPWLPFGPEYSTPYLGVNATEWPAERLPLVTHPVLLGEFRYLIVGDADEPVVIPVGLDHVNFPTEFLDETGAPIPFTTDGVLIIPDDSTEPGRCCEGSLCRVVSPQECGGLFERGGNCDLPCECSEINPCARYFLTPQGYDALSAPWGRHIPYTAAPGDRIGFDLFIELQPPGEQVFPGSEVACGQMLTESGFVEFSPPPTSDSNHPLFVYPNGEGGLGWWWSGDCGAPPDFDGDFPLIGAVLHSFAVQITEPRYIATVYYEVSEDGQGSSVIYLPMGPGIAIWTGMLIPYRPDGVLLHVMPQQVLSSDPPNGSIDARQPIEPGNPEIRFGWNSIELTFSGNLDESIDGELSVVEVGGDGNAPAIGSIEHLDLRRIRVILSEPIEPGAWTCVEHEPSGTRSCLGYLPGDVSGDGTASPVDILKLIDGLNGVANPPLATHQTDLDRSGQSTPADVLRLIDLLNGAGDFDPWNYARLPAIP